MKTMTYRYTDELKKLRYFHWDSCRLCNYNFIQGDACNSGYRSNGEPLYVCDNCTIHLTELAARETYSPRPYEIPTGHSTLWRYMDFTKFLSILDTQSLFFSRVDKLADPFEGARGTIDHRQTWDNHLFTSYKQAALYPPGGHQCTLTAEQIDTQSRQQVSITNTNCEKARQVTYINCWHENHSESEAMWNLYSTDTTNAIADRKSVV